jgi:hypothetical protein
MIEGLKICARIVILGATFFNLPLPTTLQTYLRLLYRHYESDCVNIGLAMTDLLAYLCITEISVDPYRWALPKIRAVFLKPTVRAKMYGSLALIAKVEPDFVYGLLQSDVEGKMTPTKAMCIFAVSACAPHRERLRLPQVELTSFQRLDIKMVPDAIGILVIWMRMYVGEMEELEFRVLAMCLKLCATLVRRDMEGVIGRMHIPFEIWAQVIEIAAARFHPPSGWWDRLAAEWHDEPERLGRVQALLNLWSSLNVQYV